MEDISQILVHCSRPTSISDCRHKALVGEKAMLTWARRACGSDRMSGWADVRIHVGRQWRKLQETEGTHPMAVKMSIGRQCGSMRRMWASMAQDSIAQQLNHLG